MSESRVNRCDGPECREFTEITVKPLGARAELKDSAQDVIVIELKVARRDVSYPTGIYHFCSGQCLSRWAVAGA